MFVCARACVCVNINTYVCIYITTHEHINTHTLTTFH